MLAIRKSIIIIALIIITAKLTAQSFSLVDPGFDIAFYPAAEWVDVDNDGDLDAFIAGEDTTGVAQAHLYRNDGGIFTKISTSITGVSHASCEFGDMNNDGLSDLAIIGFDGTSAVSKIYRNDGGGSFSDISAGLTALYDGDVSWIDYNNDGLMDVLISGFDDTSVPMSILYRNEGNGVFSESGILITGLARSSHACSDLDLDMDMDLVICGMDNNANPSTIIYLNESGSFTEMGAGITGVYLGSLDLGDYNNDSHPDLLISGKDNTGNPVCLVYKNNNGNSFSMLSGVFQGVSAGSSIWGDFNNDGLLDFYIGGNPNQGGTPPPMPTVAISGTYINQGSDAFLWQETILPGIRNNTIVCGDYDGDTDLDLLVSGEVVGPISPDATTAMIYRNEISALNNPPSSPSNLAYQLSGILVEFSWDASSDDKTPSAGLNYNLRIGSQTNNMDIVSVLADLSNGDRRIVRTGNCSGNTSWSVSGLGFGEYYASVQALDHDFAGSAFSPDLIFEVIPTASFLMQDTACIFTNVSITYTGNASPTAQYLWDFDGATISSGTGPGPYVVYWTSHGIKEVSLTVIENGATSEPVVNEINILPFPPEPGEVTGVTDICQGSDPTSYSTVPLVGVTSYIWGLYPVNAGTINGTGLVAMVEWDPGFTGYAYVYVRGENACGIGPVSDSLEVFSVALPGQPGKPEGPQELCKDSPATTYSCTQATSANGYQWSLFPDEAGTIIGSWLSAEVDWSTSFVGVAGICVSSFNDCGAGPSSDTTFVIVHAPPLANAGNTQVIPSGNSTQLQGSATGGSGNYTYYWSPPELLLDPNVPDPTTVELMQSTAFVLNVTDELTNCVGTDQVVVTVTGGALSVEAVANPDAICSGDSTQLLALVSGGSGKYVYSWTSSPSGFIADSASPVAFPEASTIYFINVTDQSEQVHDSVFVMVSPKPDPPGEIFGPEEVCAGEEQVLYEIDPVPNATKYLWEMDEGIFGSSDSTSIIVNFSNETSSGMISVMPLNDCGLGEPSIIIVNISEVPEKPESVYGTDSLCTTTDTISTYAIISPVPGVIGYEWKFEPDEAGYIVGNSDHATVFWTKNWEGIAAVMLRFSNECGYSVWSDPMVVHAFNCLGIPDPDERMSSLLVYPNPAREVLNVGGWMLDESTNYALYLNDLYGRLICRESIRGRNIQRINVSHLPEGLYILSITDERGWQVSAKVNISH